MRVWIVITAVVSLGGCKAEPETPDVPRPPRPKIELAFIERHAHVIPPSGSPAAAGTCPRVDHRGRA